MQKVRNESPLIKAVRDTYKEGMGTLTLQGKLIEKGFSVTYGKVMQALDYIRRH